MNINEWNAEGARLLLEVLEKESHYFGLEDEIGPWERARPAQVSDGGEAMAVAAAMLRIAPTCESDWDKQLREWASRLSSTPQARPDGGEAVAWMWEERSGADIEEVPELTEEDCWSARCGFRVPEYAVSGHIRNQRPLYTHPAPAPDNEAFRGLDSAGRPIYGNRPTVTTTTADNTAPAPDVARVPDAMIVLLNHLEDLMDAGKLAEDAIPVAMWNAVSMHNVRADADVAVDRNGG